MRESGKSAQKNSQKEHLIVTGDDFVPNRNKKDWNTEKKKETSFGYAQQNFENAKSISSTNFFGESEKKRNPEADARLEHFSGAKSISSAQVILFFKKPTTFH